jgi:hypothetical protein
MDAFIVRSILAPALVTAFGRFGGWPGKELAVSEEDVAEADAEAAAEAESAGRRVVIRHGG